MSIEKQQDREVLAKEDVRAMVRLLGEVCAMAGDHAAKKRRLMEGLCELVGADAWAWSLVQLKNATPAGQVVYLHGGMSEEAFSLYLQSMVAPDIEEAMAGYVEEAVRAGRQITRTDEQFVPPALIGKLECYRLWYQAGLGGVLLSTCPLPDGGSSSVGLYRNLGRTHFGAREIRLAHIILTEVPWLHTQGWAKDAGKRVPYLSPRLRVTLNLLIEGLSRNKIAEQLKISPHTAAGYIKDVYNYFEVHSQMALISHFQRGDGGDIPSGQRQTADCRGVDSP